MDEYFRTKCLYLVLTGEDSFVLHDNTIANIDDPEDALGVEDSAGDQNTLFSNVLIDSDNGLTADIDQT